MTKALVVLTVQKDIDVSDNSDLDEQVVQLIKEIEKLGYCVDVDTVEPYDEIPD